MGVLQPNVTLYGWGSSDKRTGVKVNGVPMAGVVAVSLSKDVVERVRPDGWLERQATGEEFVTIKVMRRFVSFEGDQPA